MINIKFSAVLGCAGFVLSLLVGLFTGAGFPLIFVRAGIFGAVFFALGCGLWLLINNFVPELLFPENSASGESAGLGDISGSRVNITLDDSRVLPEMYRNLDNGDEVGNIGDLVSGAFKPAETPRPRAGDESQGLDQNPEAGYTGNEAWGNLPSSDGLGGLPDMDSMAGSFLSEVDDDLPGPSPRSDPARSPSGNRPQKMDGDFNPKDLAAGIRTVLSKDE